MNKYRKVLFTALLYAVLLFSLSAGGSKASGESDASGKSTLYIYNWSYYTPEEVVEAFEEEYNCNVVFDYFASNEEMFAKFMAAGGVGYDLVVPSGDYVSIMKNLGMLKEIDHSKIPNLKYMTDLVKEKSSFDPGQQYSIPYYMGAAGIAVHTSKVADYPRSWSLFSESSLKGKLCMMDDTREVMGAALAYLGYSINSTNPDEIAETYDLINNSWKPNLAKFDAEGFGKSFSTYEYYAAHGYAEVFFEEVPEEEWDEIDFFIPEEGCVIYADNFVIPAKAEHYDLACEFINFFLEPENYAKFLDRFHFPSSIHTEAGNYMTVKPFYTTEMMQNGESRLDVGEDLALYNDAWQKIRYM